MQTKEFKTIDDLIDEINFNGAQMQTIINHSNIDSDVLEVINKMIQLNHYNITAIVQYLENNS